MCIYISFIGPLYDYYLGFFENYRSGGYSSILLTTTEKHPVTYFIEVPGLGYHSSGVVSADDQVILSLPRNVQVQSIRDQEKGIYLTASSMKITVIGQNLHTRTSDSFFAIPIIELDGAYVYYGISAPRAIIHSEAISSSVLIVGTENNTIMSLTVTQLVSISVENTITRLIPDREYSFMINRLQTVFITSREDLSGTKVVTDKPVSVFSGHECANVPRNVRSCSHLIEQIPPTALWGKIYLTAPLADKRSYTIKTLAAYNSTIVKIYCNNTMESYDINEGEFINRISQYEYCAIHSNKEVLVAQFSHGGAEDNGYGDPMMTLVPAVNQYLNKIYFSTISSNPAHNHYVNIIVKEQYYQPDMIYLMAGGVNRSLVTQQWIPIQVNTTIEAYVTQVNIPEGMAQVLHSNPVAQMMTIVYGFAMDDGYGHIGGFSIPDAAGCYFSNS